MALIECKECKKEISDKAEKCPNCGCPVSEMVSSGIVKIKMPNDIVIGWVGLFSSRNASVHTTNGDVLWKGQHGQTASFKIDSPMRIIIDLGGWANAVEGIVEPRKKYTLVQDLGAHLLATYRLSEVDVIDSEF